MMRWNVAARVRSALSCINIEVSIIYLAAVVFYKLILDLSFHPYLDYHVLSLYVLRESLFKSLFYMHMQPPGFNLLVGIVAKLPIEFDTAFCGLHLVAGLAAIHFLARIGVRETVCVGVIALTCWFPTMMIYANWGLSAHLEFCLCCALMYGLAAGVDAPLTFRSAMVIFIPYCLLGMLRPQWHLFVGVALGLLLLFFRRSDSWKWSFVYGMLTALAPLFLVYLKNYLLYGFFGSSSWLGDNLYQIAVYLTTADELHQMIADGQVSPFFTMDGGLPRNLLVQKAWEAKGYHLPAIDHPSLHEGQNFLAYIPGAEQNFRDSMAIIERFPDRYLGRVWDRLYDVFHIASFNYPYANLIWLNIEYTKLPMAFQLLVDKCCILVYAIIPLWAFIASLFPRGYVRRHRTFTLTGLFIASSMLIISCALNGYEQERMRWAQEPFYLAFLAMLVEVTCRVASARRSAYLHLAHQEQEVE